MRAARAALACLALAAVFLAGPALAQRGGGTPGEFDFYVLALSWSPNYCEARGDSRGSPQCEPGRNLGFVVHGLWPQYERGYPSNCGGNRSAPRYALDEAKGVFPDEGLARHEWRQHGTCSGLPPSAYFRAVRTARDKVRIPEAMAALDRDSRTTPQAIERAFSEANPGLRPDMISVQCSRGALKEVRICLTRDLRTFTSCPEIDRRACRFGPIRVSAPR